MKHVIDMKFKKLMLVTFILLAILTIGAASATENANGTITDKVTCSDETIDSLSVDYTT